MKRAEGSPAVPVFVVDVVHLAVGDHDVVRCRYIAYNDQGGGYIEGDGFAHGGEPWAS